MSPRDAIVRQQVIRRLKRGDTLRQISAETGVPISTIASWRVAAGVRCARRQGQHRPLAITKEHTRVLQAVRSGAESLAAVSRRLLMPSLTLELLASDLVWAGKLCALDGEPWCLTPLGVRELLSAKQYRRWCAAMRGAA